MRMPMIIAKKISHLTDTRANIIMGSTGAWIVGIFNCPCCPPTVNFCATTRYLPVNFPSSFSSRMSCTRAIVLLEIYGQLKSMLM